MIVRPLTSSCALAALKFMPTPIHKGGSKKDEFMYLINSKLPLDYEEKSVMAIQLASFGSPGHFFLLPRRRNWR